MKNKHYFIKKYLDLNKKVYVGLNIFLHQNKIFNLFFYNLYQNTDNRLGYYISDTKLNLYYTRKLINYAFEWNKTKEGYLFWATVGQKWQDYFNKNLKNKL